MDPTAIAPTLPGLPAPDTLGPLRPKGWKKPKKPKATDIVSRANRQYDDHVLRADQYVAYADWLNQDRRGIFDRDEEDVESGEVETPPCVDITEEHNQCVTFHAGMDVTIDIVPRDPNDEDEAQALEDYLTLSFDDWEEQHRLEGGGPLRRTLPDWAQRYAILATYVDLDPANTSTGIYRRTVPGATIYPVWGGAGGLKALYRIYDADGERIIGEHDDDGSVRTAMEDEVGYAEEDEPFAYRVIEYYDDHWAMVIVNDIAVKTWEHKRGFVPWAITPMAFGGDPLDLSSNRARPMTSQEFQTSNAFGTNRVQDLARQYQPFLWRRVATHAAEEAIMGRMMTLARRATGIPPVVLKQGVISEAEGDPEIDGREQGVTKLREDDALEPFPQIPVAEIMTPLQTWFAQNRQFGMAPGLAMGAQNPASQMSGTALELGRQGGYEKWAGVTMGIEAHLMDVFRLTLRLVQEWGDGLGEGDTLGALLVPRRAASRGVGALHEITPDLIRKTSVRVRVTLSRFNPMSLTSTGNGVQIWRSQGLMAKRSGIKIGGWTNDVDGELEAIGEDELADVPEVKQAHTLDRLYKRAQRAMEKGDDATGRELLLEAHYVASTMQLAFMQKMMMLQGMMGGQNDGSGLTDDGSGQQAQGGPPQNDQQPPPSDQPPGVPTPVPPPLPPAIQGQGQSMPNFGKQTGQLGGRPPEPGQGGPNYG